MIHVSTAVNRVRGAGGRRHSKVKDLSDLRLAAIRKRSNDNILSRSQTPYGSEDDEGRSRHHSFTLRFEPTTHNHNDCQRVVINISGLRFQTQLRTLNRFPDTLLGDPARRTHHFDPIRNEYFFDRYRPSFEAILYYYQSGGQLRRPDDVALDVFSEEIKFFELGEAATNQFRADQGYAKKEEELLPTNLFQRQVWLMLESAESSKAAKILAHISTFVIFLSVATFCLETLPQFKHYTLYQLPNDTILVEEYEMPVFTGPFFIIETSCIIWFSLELILGILSCPDKLLFFQDAFVIINLMSIIPYFLTLVTAFFQLKQSILPKTLEETESSHLSILRGMRLIRVFRVLKLSKRSKGLRVLGKTLRASVKELLLIMSFISIMTVLFSSVVYFAEGTADTLYFKSIPEGFWWALVTMTTVGYGDIVPVGLLGKLVGSMCFLAGVLTIALPVPFIEGNFNYFCNLESKRKEMESQCPNHIPSCPCSPITSGESTKARSSNPDTGHMSDYSLKRSLHKSVTVNPLQQNGIGNANNPKLDDDVRFIDDDDI